MPRIEIPYSYVDSFSAPCGVVFSTLKARLIRFIVTRISNGEFSERGLARLLRVSQPQLHKVLKGERKLTSDLADRILARFEISVLDLLESPELKVHLTPQSGGPMSPMPLEDGIDPDSKVSSPAQNPDIPHKRPASETTPRKSSWTKTA